MFYSGSTNLKYYKRLNVYRNSTDSCSYNPETFTGYSYNEEIIKTITYKKKKIKIFNYYHFSNTTSSHQRALKDLYDDIPFTGIVVELSSINRINSIKDLIKTILEKSFYSDINYHLDNEYTTNLKVLEKYGTKKNIKDYTNTYNKKLVKLKAEKSLDIKIKKLKNLNYSEKNLIKKAVEISEFLYHEITLGPRRLDIRDYTLEHVRDKKYFLETFIGEKHLLLINHLKENEIKNITVTNTVYYYGDSIENYNLTVKILGPKVKVKCYDTEFLELLNQYNKMNKLFNA